MTKHNQKTNFLVAALYCFTSIDQTEIYDLSEEITIQAQKNLVLGTILLAKEGVNGTICGTEDGIYKIIEIINTVLGNNRLELKFSWSHNQVFRKFRVRKKAEIVTMGVDYISPEETTGIYVEPKDWNSCLKDENTLVIDTRNEYEIGIGGFKGSINPHINSFRDFPYWVGKHLKTILKNKQPKKIAMFCTGGIRCEKATSLLLNEGFENVYHLHGGILKYLEDVPKDKSLWDGECFVFDQRVALTKDLVQGDYSMCYACGMPLSSKDREKINYVRGVSCYHCKDSYSEKDRARFAERQKQYDQNSKFK